MPTALMVIILLTGPTLVWLLYQFVVQPRTSRYAGGSSDLLWVCSRCRSANEARPRGATDAGSIARRSWARSRSSTATAWSRSHPTTPNHRDDDIDDDDVRAPVPVMAPVAAALPHASPPPAVPGRRAGSSRSVPARRGPSSHPAARRPTDRGPRRRAPRCRAPGVRAARAPTPRPPTRSARSAAAVVVVTVDDVADPALEA